MIVRIAMIGTRGVPARYGGFETAVEEVGARLVERGHEVIVYCRNRGQRLTEHRGMRLVNLPAIRRRELETLSHASLSIGHSVLRSRPDVAVVFNAANAPLLPVLRAARVPVVVHVDGLEWKRAKWRGWGARYYRWAEGRSVRSADAVVADAVAIATYVERAHGRQACFIPYGADLVDPPDDRLAEVGVEPGRFHLVVARFEPENHVLEIVRGHLASAVEHPLVVVGGTPYSLEYAHEVRALVVDDRPVRFTGSIWDQDLLDQLYAHATTYIHGHSVGGTNPSLLRAMGAGAAITAFDVNFNREVTGGNARFFTTSEELARILASDEQDPLGVKRRAAAARDHAAERYRWDDVAASYEALCRVTADRRPRD